VLIENFKIKQGLELLSIDNNSELIAQFEDYYKYLKSENLKYNLTSITDLDDYVDLHILDSLSIFLPLRQYQIDIRNVLDIGTGAGFPGLPFKLCKQDINLTLVDSVNKKTDFLSKIISLLNVKNVEVINDRIENLGHEEKYRESQDLIVSRAVAKLPSLIEVSLPLLKDGGYCIFHKSNLSVNEYDSMIKTVDLFRASLIDVFEIPFSLVNRNRVLVIIQKSNDIDIKYPRSNNKPFRKPLF
jgi:16S rRNA (guanine527-N7)-methyltransferase